MLITLTPLTTDVASCDIHHGLFTSPITILSCGFSLSSESKEGYHITITPSGPQSTSCPQSVTSSSLGATTSFFERFGLLNIQFPLIAILDAASPILYFQFLHVISYVIFPSALWSP